MSDAPQPLAPGSPLTMGPDFVGAPLRAEDYPTLDYPVSYGLENPSYPPPPALFTTARHPLQAQRLLVFLLDNAVDTSTVGLTAWEDAKDAVIAGLDGKVVTVQTNLALFGGWLTMASSVLTRWTGPLVGTGPVAGSDSAVGFSGDVLVYAAFSLSFEDDGTSSTVPRPAYVFSYNLLKASLHYDSFLAGAPPLNHKFEARVIRLSTPDNPANDAQTAAAWANAQAGFAGGYPLADVGVVPQVTNPDLADVKAFFGLP